MKIEEYIPNGAGAAVTDEQLAKLLGMTTREVQNHVRIARLNGVPICASNAEPYGFYIAETAAELEGCVKSLDRRIKSIRETRLALGDTLAKMTGQQTIEGA